MTEYRCELCGVKLNSKAQLFEHYYVHLLLTKYAQKNDDLSVKSNQLRDYLDQIKLPNWTKIDLVKELFS